MQSNPITSPRKGEVRASLRVRGNKKQTGGAKSTPLAPVILGPVPRIFWQRVSNLVNKLALLLNKCWLREDTRNKSEYDGCRGRGVSLVSSKQRSVAAGNKVVDTRLPQPAGCGDKYDVSCLGYKKYRLLFSSNRHKLSEAWIMRLIRINFFSPCTKRYTRIKS